MKIVEKVHKQMRYNYSVRKEKIRYIVVHDTGNPSAGADTEAHYNYFNNGNRGSSADIFVDDVSVWYVNDYSKYYSWHCGDGKGRYGITNANSIGVEMCINLDGNYIEALKNTASVVRELMQELNIPESRVVRHYDASRKNCPASMNKGDWKIWKEFKLMIKEREELTMAQYEELKKEIRELTETVKILATEVAEHKNPMVYNFIDDNMPSWARPTIQKLVDQGYLKGDENGLNLTDELLRILVINDRAGIYDK